MGYATDGRSHANGTGGEASVIKQINNNKLLSDHLGGGTAIQLGGTKNVADIIVSGIKKEVSVKTYTGASGTTDIINTTRFEDYIESYPELNELRFYIDLVRGAYSDTEMSKAEARPVIDSVRKVIQEKSNAALEALNSRLATALLHRAIKTRLPMGLETIVNHIPSGKLYAYDSGNHPVHNVAAVYAKRVRAKGSRMLMESSTDEYTGFRLRFALNNGVGALLAGEKWSSNKSSSLTFKLQYESNDKVLETLEQQGLLKTFEVIKND